MARVILNAGHGGSDAGAIYNKRLEKNDNLRLVQEVGEILEANNVEVIYPRTDDSYLSPVDRVKMINELGGDLLVSIHRDYVSIPNSRTGARVYINQEEQSEVETQLANNILDNLEFIGFRNNGISERWYYLLSNTSIPGIELLVGYISTDKDNEIFDERFNDIAYAIADGIMKTLGEMGLM